MQEKLEGLLARNKNIMTHHHAFACFRHEANNEDTSPTFTIHHSPHPTPSSLSKQLAPSRLGVPTGDHWYKQFQNEARNLIQLILYYASWPLVPFTVVSAFSAASPPSQAIDEGMSPGLRKNCWVVKKDVHEHLHQIIRSDIHQNSGFETLDILFTEIKSK